MTTKILILSLLWAGMALAQPLAGTSALEEQGDLAMRMVSSIDRYLLRQTEAAPARRETLWSRDYSSFEAYERSVRENRELFRRVIGVVDERVKPEAGFELISTTATPARLAETGAYVIDAVRWPVFEGVYGEGLLLTPKGPIRADVVALPDADWSPEMLAGLAEGVSPQSQFARRFAESGCRVLIPVLIDRQDTWSELPGVKATNLPHREFVYRMAYELGRHIIGYETQKVMAAIDRFKAERADRPVAVFGYGEGGLIALYSGAIDPRIDVTGVSGYFQPREQLWQEPIYRNVWTLVERFGDADIAGLIAPRGLVIEGCRMPDLEGPPAASEGRQGAAPGAIRTPSREYMRSEAERAKAIFDKLGAGGVFEFRLAGNGTGQPGADETLDGFLKMAGVAQGLKPSGNAPQLTQAAPDASARMRRQLAELVNFTQELMRTAEQRRGEFWAKADLSSPDAWQSSTKWYRKNFWEEVIGRLPDPTAPLAASTRLAYDEPRWRGYEVMLPVWEGVFAYGVLLVPKDLSPGERRPVVVAQHGLEGRPRDVVDPRADTVYHSYGAKLADRGFIVFAPQNPYIGRDQFRVLQRKANPLKLSLFSFITGQHQRILEWLGGLEFVDAKRIGFYGLSYGGKTAMRVPALLENYALSICSADFNEWIWKNSSSTSRYSYVFTGEYEMFEFDMGNTFNYAEMAWLIAPRPFMVERGHADGVSKDEMVAYEFARVRRRYAELDIPGRTEIEFFDGPHEIHGVGTFRFLEKHLGWNAQQK